MLRLVTLLITQVFVLGLFAQEKHPGALNTWDFTLTVGTISSPSSSQLESALRDAHFNYPGSTSLFGNDGKLVSYPHSQGEISWSFSAQRKFNAIISTALHFDFIKYGSVVGKGEAGQVLRISTKTNCFSPVFYYSLNQWLLVGAGPSLIFMTREKNFVKEVSGSAQLGGVTGLSIKIPSRSNLFALLNIQYRWMPRQSIGPYIEKSGAQIAYFPTANVLFNQLYFNIGLGVRFFQKK